jgi:APA family basic amino acid/polyamine antiporter
LQIGEVAELTNIGTLAAFIIVSAAVIILRKRRPDIKRTFKCPGVPFIPLIAILICGYLIVVLPTVTHIRFVVWLVIGFVVYFLYSKNHSLVRVKGK